MTFVTGKIKGWLGLVSVDVVVCSKNRNELLVDCFDRIRRVVPCRFMFLYDGSDVPDLDVYKVLVGLNVKIISVSPDMRFGAVRAKIMNEVNADYIAMIDDDIILQSNWFNALMNEFKCSRVVAVSSNLIFSDPILAKLGRANKRVSVVSGGAAIYDRKAILEIGNFNPNIHRGEDMELELRINACGKRWVKSNLTFAVHPLTIQEFLRRAKCNVVGWDFIMKNSKYRFKFLVVRFGSCFVMPVYYFFKTFDLRASGLWMVYKFQSLLYWLSGKYVK